MAEEIPSQDQVSRHIDSPEKWHPDERRFVEDRLFLFKKPEEVESMVWRKYAPLIGDVHALGCARQVDRRVSRPDWTYEGAITAQVGEIRSIQNSAGDRFEVVHAPAEGEHHVHIECQFAQDQQYLKQRKSDLKEFLRKIFSPLEAHSCAP
jgi:hypothetical protein